ncbi:hypothetical protein ACJQWK_05011 [Exserohilum turcicum]|uniref:Methyltransferase n=1 Tax=Exserohilum turcicum (strain 28A) TaxID=671987 RepID=R0JXS9_EXST2|nr:uncharacterized protein SETTUDRAFT_23543 [Exserohilum turcica Et28A]EOA82299.1 hypothetical protein SETTUDRAFT_23543 [Exserohilum turcica Et28A]
MALTAPTMEVFMDKTESFDNHVTEQVRLEDQHETIMHAMGGKAVYAPIDLTQPGLRILDSACANGRWIKDMQASFPFNHEYVGTDVVDSLYPVPAPAGVHFQNQSIKEAFPEQWKGTFNLVHQRLVMAAAAPEKAPLFVVENLASMLKADGWLQMVEVITTPLSENPASKNQYIDMLDTLYANLYGNSDLNKPNLMSRLPQAMKDAGLRNVQQTEVLVKYGAAVSDPAVREKSLRTAVAGVPYFLSVLKAIPGVFKDEWNDLETRLYKDLAEQGGYMKYIVCWGQK